MIDKNNESSFLALVIENISEGLCVCHNTDEFPYVRFTVWNKSMTELTGYTIDEINLSGWYQTVYPDPDIQQKAIKRMEEMRHGNELQGEEWEITRSDGNKKWLSISTSIVKDENNIVHVMAIMSDITNRKEAEEEKEKLKSQLRTMIDSCPAWMACVDTDCNYLIANKYYTETFHTPLSQVEGHNFKEFFPPDLYERHKQLIAQSFAIGKSLKWEDQYMFEEDRITYLYGVYTPLYDKAGSPWGMSAFAQDVSQLKQAEEELKSQQKFIKEALDAQNDTFFVFDSFTGKALQWNKAFENISGYSNEEISSLKAPENYYSKEDLEKASKYIESVLRGGAGIVELELICKDGHRVPTEYSASIIRDAEGNPKSLISIGRDISERKKAEKEKAILEAQLLHNQKMEAVGLLAGGIAHDFNNILAAILGNINLALFDEGLKDDTKKLLSDAEKATIRAKDLTQQLLTFSKGGAPVKEVSSLDNVIKDSADFVLRGDEVACRYNIHKDLWLVDIDKGQISQVIQNIVLNASHAMPEGGIIKITCENFVSVGKDILSFAKGGRFIKISIQDSGIGMPANVVDKIFDPYFSTKHKGRGLGLSIVHSIIKKHHGHISTESAPGVGSTFTIYLPASEKNKTQTKGSPAENKTSTRAKILVMDDEKMVRTLAKKMLVKLGHEVVLATDGEEAVKLYQLSMTSGKPFELAIMDLTIPGGMGGKEAVQEVLNIDPNTKVIVSSGYSTDSIMANYKDYGFDAAIVKPYSTQELSKVISQLLD